MVAVRFHHEIHGGIVLKNVLPLLFASSKFFFRLFAVFYVGTIAIPLDDLSLLIIKRDAV